MTAEELLDQFDDIENMIMLLNSDLAQARKQILAPVQDQLNDLEDEFAPKIEEANAKLAELKALITPLVLAQGSTVKGQHVQAVYSSGARKWNTDGLAGYAVAHPEILAFFTPGEPRVTFRKVGK